MNTAENKNQRILSEESIIIEIEKIKPVGFGNKAVGQFRMVQGPRYVCFHIFQTEDWIHPNELNGILSALITGGHSFTVRNVEREVSFDEYESYRDFEASLVSFNEEKHSYPTF